MLFYVHLVEPTTNNTSIKKKINVISEKPMATNLIDAKKK